MSVKFSNSPTLRLRIADSAIRRGLHGVCWGLCLLSLWLIFRGGYPLLAMVLLLPVLGLLWPGRREPLAGAVLAWRQGLWYLEQGDGERLIELSRASAALPWLVYLQWREPARGRAGSLWLFADSTSVEEMRQLRVRLLLER